MVPSGLGPAPRPPVNGARQRPRTPAAPSVEGDRGGPLNQLGDSECADGKHNKLEWERFAQAQSKRIHTIVEQMEMSHMVQLHCHFPELVQVLYM